MRFLWASWFGQSRVICEGEWAHFQEKATLSFLLSPPFRRAFSGSAFKERGEGGGGGGDKQEMFSPRRNSYLQEKHRVWKSSCTQGNSQKVTKAISLYKKMAGKCRCVSWNLCCLFYRKHSSIGTFWSAVWLGSTLVAIPPSSFNPLLPKSPYKNYRQTMQTLTRRHIMWRLVRVSLFANRMFIKTTKKRQNRPDTPKLTNGLVQHITVEESTSIQWTESNTQFWKSKQSGCYKSGFPL